MARTYTVFDADVNKLKSKKTISSKKISQVDDIKAQEKSRKKLRQLANKSYEVLCSFKSAFPFDIMFPDEVTVDSHKVNIIFRDFPGNTRVHSVMIKNIVDVFVDTNPIYATLRIVDSAFGGENTVDVPHLRVADAIYARRIILGLIIARENNIDLTKLDTREVIDKLEEIGKARLAE